MLHDLDADGKVALKYTLEKQDGGCGLNSFSYYSVTFDNSAMECCQMVIEL